MRARVTAIRSVACLILASCGEPKVDRVSGPSSAVTVSDSALRALAEGRVFFAHQSVGGNIVQGLQEWMARDARIRLRIVESDNPQTVQGPAFMHAYVGENGIPASKMAEFAAILSRGMGSSGGVALLKFCYLDFQPQTDADSLFAQYRREVSALQSAYPALRIVHVTVPLTADESRLRLLVKKLLGKSTTRDLNAARNRYNQLLLREYGPSGAVFDLAAAESTKPDGARQFFRVGTDTIYTLATTLTSDGGHLNDLGRRLVAERLLAFLATLPTGMRPPS